MEQLGEEFQLKPFSKCARKFAVAFYESTQSQRFGELKSTSFTLILCSQMKRNKIKTFDSSFISFGSSGYTDENFKSFCWNFFFKIKVKTTKSMQIAISEFCT